MAECYCFINRLLCFITRREKAIKVMQHNSLAWWTFAASSHSGFSLVLAQGGGVLDKVSRGSDRQARNNLIPQLFHPIKFSGEKISENERDGVKLQAVPLCCLCFYLIFISFLLSKQSSFMCLEFMTVLY